MKIVFVLPGQGRSGGVRCTVSMANYLLARGHEVRLLVHRQNLKAKVKDLWNGLLYPGRHDWIPTFKGAVSTYKTVEACRFGPGEIVVAVGMWCSAQLARTGDTGHVKLQYLHGLTPWMPEVMEEALSSPLPKVSVSPEAVGEVETRGGGPVLAIIPNGIETTEYFPCRDAQQRNGIGTIFSSHPAKDPETIGKILKILASEHPDVPQYVFGSPDAKHPEIVYGSYCRYPSVQQARQMYSHCKVWFVASRSEGFGAPILEAMACGCAVVSTDCGGPRTIITDGENGLLSPVGDADEIAKKIGMLIQNEPMRQRLVDNSMATVAKFSWQHSVDIFERVLVSISKEHQMAVVHS